MTGTAVRLLCLATSGYADPAAREWHPDLRLTVGHLRRSGLDVGYRYVAVPAGPEELGAEPHPDILFTEVSEENRDVVLPLLDRVAGAWPTTTVLVGGVVGSLDHRAVLDAHPGVDACVVGERDTTLAALAAPDGPLHALPGTPGVATRDGTGPPRGLLPDLDVLGGMALDGIPELLPPDGTRPVAYLQGSRGCPCRCSFCAVPDLYRPAGGSPWRGRSPAVVVAEMVRMREELEAGAVVFQDDNFVGPGRAGQERARAIAARLVRQRLDVPFSFCCTLASLREDTLSALMEAGLARIGISVEATDADSLRLLGKGHRPDRIYPALRLVERLGLRCDVNLIFFGPYTSMAAVRDGLRLLEYVRESPVLGYSDAFPFTTLHAFPWSRVAGELAARSLADGGTGAWVFRDPAVAVVAAFAARLQRASRTTFKHREVVAVARARTGDDDPSGTSTADPAGGGPPDPTLAAALRAWLGLWVVPRYVAAACDVVEAEPPGPVRDRVLAELEAAFAAEVGVAAETTPRPAVSGPVG